ncbi:hypothetical protein ACWD7F_30920 [Streptomyces sp. NPDC005122]
MDGTILLRSPQDDSLTLADLSDLAYAMPADKRSATVVVTLDTEAPELWQSLSKVLDELRVRSVEQVRLVTSAAGAKGQGRPALARRIADAWGLTVLAPDGDVLFVPGGSLFVLAAADDAGWWSFAPEAPPRPQGPRLPRPRWQAAFSRLPAHVATGFAVDRIPAGVVLRPAKARPPQAGDLFHAVPLDPFRPAVVVGVLDGVDISAEDMAALLAAAPEAVGSGVRLVPGGRQDLLPLGLALAELLDAEVEVQSGLPLLDGVGVDADAVQTVVVGPDGSPRWRPFVQAVICMPPRNGVRPTPRPIRWRSPDPRPGADRQAMVRLSDQWQAAATRAGLWVGRLGTTHSPTGHPLDPGGAVIELGRPGEPLDGTLWPVLSRLLQGLDADIRAHASLRVHGLCTDDGRELRRLAAVHGIRTIRYNAQPTSKRPMRRRQPQAASQIGMAPHASPNSGPHNVGAPSPGPSPQRQPAPTMHGSTSPQNAGAASAGPVLHHPAHPVAPVQSAHPAHPAQSAPQTGTAPRTVQAPAPEGPRSTQAEQTAFRALAGPAWERWEASASRTLDRMPPLPDPEKEAARADLIAVRLYLSASEGPLSHIELAAALRAGSERLLPYAACLGSGLRRLPPFQGAVLIGSSADDTSESTPAAGTVLHELAPVCGLPVDDTGPPLGARYAIWSTGGRRVQQSRGSAPSSDQVVFAPGTRFRVLEVRPGQRAPLVLMRELPAGDRVAEGETNPFDRLDRAALAGLHAALRGKPRDAVSFVWPERCCVPLGRGTEPPRSDVPGGDTAPFLPDVPGGDAGVSRPDAPRRDTGTSRTDPQPEAGPAAGGYGLLWAPRARTGPSVADKDRASGGGNGQPTEQHRFNRADAAAPPTGREPGSVPVW